MLWSGEDQKLVLLMEGRKQTGIVLRFQNANRTEDAIKKEEAVTYVQIENWYSFFLLYL